MSRKLRKLIREEDRTVAKIEELQEHLKEIRAARKQEEDSEILKSIRGLKLEAWDLFNMLTGIQDGTVSMEARDPLPEDTQDVDPAGADGDAAEAGTEEGLPGEEYREDTEKDVPGGAEGPDRE